MFWDENIVRSFLKIFELRAWSHFLNILRKKNIFFHLQQAFPLWVRPVPPRPEERPMSLNLHRCQIVICHMPYAYAYAYAILPYCHIVTIVTVVGISARIGRRKVEYIFIAMIIAMIITIVIMIITMTAITSVWGLQGDWEGGGGLQAHEPSDQEPDNHKWFWWNLLEKLSWTWSLGAVVIQITLKTWIWPQLSGPCTKAVIAPQPLGPDEIFLQEINIWVIFETIAIRKENRWKITWNRTCTATMVTSSKRSLGSDSLQCNDHHFR